MVVRVEILRWNAPFAYDVGLPLTDAPYRPLSPGTDPENSMVKIPIFRKCICYKYEGIM